MTANELRKYFKVGDHVKAIGGRFEGDTGLVIRVDASNKVHVFSDVANQEVCLWLLYSSPSRIPVTVTVFCLSTSSCANVCE